MNRYIDHLKRKRLYDQIPFHDAVSKQQFILFRIFSFSGSLVCLGVSIKMLLTISNPGFIPFIILGLCPVMMANYFLVRKVEKLKLAYTIMLSAACLLLHLVAYDCGGIQTAGSFYYPAVVLYAYMLLGKKAGNIFTLIILAQIVYLFSISTFTTWTSFKLFKNDQLLINEDFIVNLFLSIFLVSNLSRYLQSGKNVIIQRLEQSYATLEEKNKLLEEKNSLLKSYTTSLEKKNAELEKFASIASHDLKSPLRAIGSLTSMIEEKLDSKDDELKSHFGTIRNRVHRMENLLNALLDYSKIERTQNLYELVDFKMVITDVIQQLHPTENVSIEIPEKLPTIRGDYKKMVRVVYVLLENSIIHNDKKDVTISIATSVSNNSIFISILDNGIGFEEKYYEKIFVIFQTLQRRDEKETMGIGLSIARKIIEDIGGSLNVKSKLGEGSSFTIEIPIKCLVQGTSTNLQEVNFALIEN